MAQPPSCFGRACARVRNFTPNAVRGLARSAVSLLPQGVQQTILPSTLQRTDPRRQARYFASRMPNDPAEFGRAAIYLERLLRQSREEARSFVMELQQYSTPEDVQLFIDAFEALMVRIELARQMNQLGPGQVFAPAFAPAQAAPAAAAVPNIPQQSSGTLTRVSFTDALGQDPISQEDFEVGNQVLVLYPNQPTNPPYTPAMVYLVDGGIQQWLAQSGTNPLTNEPVGTILRYTLGAEPAPAAAAAAAGNGGEAAGAAGLRRSTRQRAASAARQRGGRRTRKGKSRRARKAKSRSRGATKA